VLSFFAFAGWALPTILRVTPKGGRCPKQNAVVMMARQMTRKNFTPQFWLHNFCCYSVHNDATFASPARVDNEQTATFMLTAPLTFGPLTFNAPMDWTFYPQDDIVLGRPPTRVGLLKLSAEFLHVIDPQASHEELWQIATRLSPPPERAAFEDREQRLIDFLPYGAATFRSGDDLVRLWYRSTHQGLIVAYFATPIIRAQQAITDVAIEDCNGMLQSARISPPDA
jgi:hypothetical protein